MTDTNQMTPLPVPLAYHLRIPPVRFIAFIVTFHAIATISALLRTFFSYHVHRKLQVDDYLLLFALLCICATAGVAYSIKDLVYLQIYVGLGWQSPPPDFYPHMLEFEIRMQVCSALVWTAIYAVKFSFLVFFRKLVSRVRLLDQWWWVVFATSIVCGLVSLPLAFVVCSNFSQNYIQYCPVQQQLRNERIYLITTTVLDVVTDSLIVSIPLLILSRAQITLARKVIIGLFLCLSIFMILIAILRTALARLPNGVIDTSWLFFGKELKQHAPSSWSV